METAPPAPSASGAWRFPAYLQGMETHGAEAVDVAVGVGSQPTYKEWKPGPAMDLTALVAGSQPTYKEWKP